MNRNKRRHQAGPKSLTIVGLGNIGSHLPPQAARIEGIGRVILVDHDIYESKNLRSQDIAAADVGRPKVQAQARRLRRINPEIEVRTMVARVEDVPLGLLRADVILAGLDSRISRRYLNQAAWRLGVPWIDAGVDASALLARVNVYVPGEDRPCPECAWDEADYAALEQAYPCAGGANRPAATNAPASLGTATAGMMAVECQKLLAGDRQHVLHGRQVMLDLRHHTHHVTTYRRNSQCHFDHQTWDIQPIADPPARLTLGRAMRLAAGDSGSSDDCSLRLEGHSFVSMLFCPSCGHHAEGDLSLSHRVRQTRRQCPQCGGTMMLRGFDMHEWLPGRVASRREHRRSLSSLGFRPGDVISVRGPAGLRHFQLGGCSPKKAGNRRQGHAPAVVVQ